MTGQTSSPGGGNDGWAQDAAEGVAHTEGGCQDKKFCKWCYEQWGSCDQDIWKQCKQNNAVHFTASASAADHASGPAPQQYRRALHAEM